MRFLGIPGISKTKLMMHDASSSRSFVVNGKEALSGAARLLSLF
jgi:hypothetical protein